MATAASPLSPRYDAGAFWTGSEVIVVGGRDDEPCPPNADCARPPEAALTDGAAYDPTVDRWREISPAPVPLDRPMGVVVDERLYVLQRDRGFLMFDPVADRWTALAGPDGPDAVSALVGLGDRVVAVRGSDELGVRPDAVYDPATDVWGPLPDDPLGLSFDRSMVATPGGGLVLTAVPLVAQPNSVEPSLYRAASYDPSLGGWTRLPDSEVVAGAPLWGWAGDLVVNAELGSADGGETNNWGRSYPFGGMLDPATGGVARPARPARARLGQLQGSAATGRSVGPVVVGAWCCMSPAARGSRSPRPRSPRTRRPAVTWADGRLFVWGGVAWNGAVGRVLGVGWVWAPAAP